MTTETPSSTPKEAKAQAKAATAYAKAQRPWFKRKRAWALGLVVLAVIVASAGSGGNSTDSTNTAAPGAGAPQDAPANVSSDKSTADAPTPNADNGASTSFPMQDGDWRLESVRLKDDGLGDFGATARITYTGDNPDGGDNLFTVTVFRGTKDVATLDGSAMSVLPGKTVSVQLISQDAYKSGPYRYTFQNNL